ncbi:hypothetical protein HGI32_16175 [Clostridium acetobutylicum]|uniref:YhfM-like domain-containing protein n=2 Tax=Clostridiaceae TaxID=31979 RepID=Q97MY6_CLOAB|nr:Hypothetical protein CA_C0053 [Clostridium acetobutylicum ATCC 824]AEI31036.1 hypothetical protein SMB_G0053 [Clostridium acetobutylicum DSM 1731]AWV81897.1 hypothetical protein DK921_17790 [Clostridium acetobutylicum]PSM05182.1 hypothetical protein C7T89_17785 [Clostridium sp. NJ4]MBC2395447.1 hypothetical protein [Clostridium acetobutylicum]
MLKMNRVFIIFIFVLLAVGCSNVVKNTEGSTLLVEKQSTIKGKYEYCNNIKDEKEVQNIKKIINSINWKDAKVSMVYPPQYKFYFEAIKEKKPSEDISYDMWISPRKDKIELVREPEGNYINLNEKTSKLLFKLLTGDNLN